MNSTSKQNDSMGERINWTECRRGGYDPFHNKLIETLNVWYKKRKERRQWIAAAATTAAIVTTDADTLRYCREIEYKILQERI